MYHSAGIATLRAHCVDWGSASLEMDDYEVIGPIAEGAHGLVVKARHLKTNEIVALKRITIKPTEKEMPIRVAREIESLRQLKHENIIRLRHTFVDSFCFVLAFEYMPSSMAEIIRTDQDGETNVLTTPVIKAQCLQLLRGVAYMHRNHVIHRDIKPSNLLIDRRGRLKIGDFGLARQHFADDIRPYSHDVATRWYRAPELLFGGRQYDEGVDIWAIGCTIAELLNKDAIFKGDNDIDQIVCVFRVLGSPSEKSWPGISSLPDYGKITFPHFDRQPVSALFARQPDIVASEPRAVDLVRRLLLYNSERRLSAEQALKHDFFFRRPFPCALNRLPRPPSRSALHAANIANFNWDDLSADIDDRLPAVTGSAAPVRSLSDFGTKQQRRPKLSIELPEVEPRKNIVVLQPNASETRRRISNGSLKENLQTRGAQSKQNGHGPLVKSRSLGAPQASLAIDKPKKSSVKPKWRI